MNKTILLSVAFLLPQLFQDVQVATFSCGKANTDQFRSLSFWIKGGKRAYIKYTHGKDPEDTDLRYMGPDTAAGKKCFRAGFPDGHSIYIIPVGDSLRVTDKSGKPFALYTWDSEGSDSLSSCPICAPDKRDAIAIVRKYFLN